MELDGRGAKAEGRGGDLQGGRRELKLCMGDALGPLSTPNTITQYLWATFSTAPICRTVIRHNLPFQHFLRSFGQLSR